MKTVPLSEGSKIEISSFKMKDGAKFLNVRKFYKTKKEDTWMPTRQGITIPEEAVKKLLRRMALVFESIDEAEELEPRNDDKPKGKSAQSASASKSKSSKKG